MGRGGEEKAKIRRHVKGVPLQPKKGKTQFVSSGSHKTSSGRVTRREIPRVILGESNPRQQEGVARGRIQPHTIWLLSSCGECEQGRVTRQHRRNQLRLRWRRRLWARYPRLCLSKIRKDQQDVRDRNGSLLRVHLRAVAKLSVFSARDSIFFDLLVVIRRSYRGGISTSSQRLKEKTYEGDGYRKGNEGLGSRSDAEQRAGYGNGELQRRAGKSRHHAGRRWT